MKRWLTVAAIAAVMTALSPVTTASADPVSSFTRLMSGLLQPDGSDLHTQVSTDGGESYHYSRVVDPLPEWDSLEHGRWISSDASYGVNRGDEDTVFRREFWAPAGLLSSSTTICVLADGAVEARLNGTLLVDQPTIGAGNAELPADCHGPVDLLRSGPNELVFTVRNDAGPIGLMYSADVSYEADDDAPPLLLLPDDMTVSPESRDGARVYFRPLAVDSRSGSHPTPSCDRASGSVFPVGTTTVECSVGGHSGLGSTGSFTVTVQPWVNGHPVLALPRDMTVTASTPEGAVVEYDATAYDDGVAPPVVECLPPSGSLFPVGDTTVRCLATDDEGVETEDSFRVTVVPANRAPELQLPADRTVNTKSLTGARVRWAVTATDDSGTPAVTCTPASGGFLRIGTTEVSCTAEDGEGLSDTGSFVVTVRGPVQRACDHLAAVRPTWSTYWLQWRLRHASEEVADARRAADARSLRQMADRVRAAGGEFVPPKLHRAAVALADRIEDRLDCGAPRVS